MSELQLQVISEQGIRDNEDTYVVDEENGLFAVFDGASSLAPYLSPDGKTGARVAAEIARDTFAYSPQEDLVTLSMRSNEAIETTHQELNIDVSDPVNRFSCTVAAMQIKDSGLHLLQSSDSLILIRQLDGSVILPLDYSDVDLETMKKWRILAGQGYSGSDIRKLVDADVKALRKLSNTDKGHGVLNGDPAVRDFLHTTTIALANVAAVLIITDGLFLPKENPEAEEDWRACFDLCEQGGIRNLYDTVREIENSDPDLTRYPRFKLHDDATGIYIKLSR